MYLANEKKIKIINFAFSGILNSKILILKSNFKILTSKRWKSHAPLTSWTDTENTS